MEQGTRQTQEGRGAILAELERVIQRLSREHLEWLLMAATVYRDAE